MPEKNYQKAFLKCMATLEPWDLKMICSSFSITPEDFTRFVCACPIRKSKWQEVCETVSLDLDKRVKGEKYGR